MKFFSFGRQNKDANDAASEEITEEISATENIAELESSPENPDENVEDVLHIEASDESEHQEEISEEALPEAPQLVQPHELIASTFLNDRWEILELTRRGAVNFYVATDDQHPGAPPVQIVQQGKSVCYEGILKDTLWQPVEVFSQDDENYVVFAGGEFRVLDDWHEKPYDERYLQVLELLIAGLVEWQKHSVVPDSDGLWGADEERNLRYRGFLRQEINGQQDDYDALLREINEKLLKRVFAPAATMRLDDNWGALPFCEETIDIIRAIQNGEISLHECQDAVHRAEPSKVLSVEAMVQTDVGQERELNEDSAGILHLQRIGQDRQQEIDFWAICDGMGGHESGEVASELAVATLQQEIVTKARDIDFNHNAQVRKVLFEIAQNVNSTVYELGKNMRTHTPPGTTMVAALRVGHRVFIVNVGDSRAYLWTEGNGLERISKDHSYVQDLIDEGELDAEDAFGHPQSNIITSNIGLKKLAKCDVFMRYYYPGDRLLLASDGVTDMLRDKDIEAILEDDETASLCQKLIDAANAAGGADNITALVAEFE